MTSAKKLALILLALLSWAIPASQSLGANAPAWQIAAVPLPSNFVPGSKGESQNGPEYFVVASNLGGGLAKGPLTLKVKVPVGLTPILGFGVDGDEGSADPSCGKPVGQEVTCTTAGPLQSGQWLGARIPVDVGAIAPTTLSAEASISGGSVPTATTTAPTLISPDPVPFGFLEGPTGLNAPLSEADGSPATQAGSHPYQLTVNFGFPTGKLGTVLAATKHVHDLITDLPPGLVGNPTATPELCTESRLISTLGCPIETQIGTVTAMTTVGGGPIFVISPLYNMVPPPGTPAELGFNALGVGLFTHVLTSLRSDGDYGISSELDDFISRPLNPFLAGQAQIWGDPSASNHNRVRGQCNQGTESCPVPVQKTAFLTMPSACSGPLVSNAHADTWEQPGVFTHASYESADLGGEVKGVEGCDGLEFEPSIEAHPSTNLTDSPSGLDVDLHQPQSLETAGRSTSALKDAVLTFPPGLTANVSQADGLAACAPEQIGLLTAIGQSPAHFSKVPDSCPEAAKLGNVEVATPLLAQYNDEHKVLRDPETGQALPEPLHGSLYIAKPFANPFGSLLAVYISIDDPKTGIVAKLAGKVEPNPLTGQLSTRFSENPQLPLEDFRAHLFAGARASLQTPLLCGTHTTTTTLTPWSLFEGGPIAEPSSSFQSTAAPGGGPCPASESAAPNAPSLSAGTLTPKAGTYSPLVAKISRADGSQRMGGLELTLPTGFSAKLAGVDECSEAQIAVAKARSHPNEGAAELASPSCPAASEVGVADVGAGAGPNPFYTRAHLYLAGPYKGAPLSMVAITPAIAGPFDLGVVVVRAALYINPETAQVRTVTDPLPTILEGIPLDVRSVAVKVQRPQFTRNPTSCDPKAFGGALTSTLGLVAPISARFQVGGCKALPYKPVLHTRLFGPIHRGGHPRLRAVFQAKPGEAGTARIVFALPHSEFIDQAHFRTICTRVQFAANQCPAGSVYGHVKAFTPLFDYPFEGPIYLRSSSHELPDVVAALRGPPRQPIAIDLVGRVDSINGGVRTTFEQVPDAPVTKAIVTLQGAKKGLFQNSTNICAATYRASLKLNGQNGKVHDSRPVLKADCPKAKGKGKSKGHGQRH
jgi:hypothetical protein